MNTWISKALLIASCWVAGCDGAGLVPESGSDGLQTVPLSGGAVMLSAPNGFCVDRFSLGASFAVMARCDTLGASGAADAPLAVITATTVAAAQDNPFAADTFGFGEERVLNRQERGAIALVQVKGTPPDPNLDDTYWRSAGQVGDQILGLAIYSPRGADDLGVKAPALLAQTMRRTLAQSRPSPDKSATQSKQPGIAKLLSGLFE